MFVKICGIRRKEDIEYVNSLKPDFIGFVFAKSKRQVAKEEAKKLISILDESIKTVGVFVNEPLEELIKTIKYLKLDIVQLHGEEDNKYIQLIKEEFCNGKRNIEIWKSVSISSKEDVKKINEYDSDKVLVDNGKGGTGSSFSWDILRNNDFNKPIVLAGGLKNENVKEAISILNPFGVDVSSGVETNGFKDFNKIKEFLNACK